MTLVSDKMGKALRLALTDPQDFWRHLRPHLFRARSGNIRVNGIVFNIDLELDPSMFNMYHGSYQWELTRLCRKFLKEGDTFIDVGANVGYISAFALGLVGKSGNVHAFEPVPRYLERLRKVHEDNPDYRLHVNGAALGEKEGTAQIAITNRTNIGWNTMVPGFMAKEVCEQEVEIGVTTLDSYLASRDVRNLRLVKIDTEGYEFPVMKGFREWLRNAKELPVLIVEVAPAAYPRLRTSLSEFSEFMLAVGYVPRSLDLVHAVELETLDRTTDVVFMPKAGLRWPTTRGV